MLSGSLNKIFLPSQHTPPNSSTDIKVGTKGWGGGGGERESIKDSGQDIVIYIFVVVVGFFV